MYKRYEIKINENHINIFQSLSEFKSYTFDVNNYFSKVLNSIYPFSIRVTINRGKPVEDKGGKMSQISEAQEKEALNTELIEEPE